MYSNTNLFLVLLIRCIDVYRFIILARVLMSWFVRDPNNKLYFFLIRITEPVLGPIRSILPRMGIDLSPIIVFVLLDIISNQLR